MWTRPTTDPARPRARHASTWLILIAALALAAAAPAAEDEVLVLVNGEPITAADLDGAIISAHSGMDMASQTTRDLRRVLEKRISDVLILQDSQGMGLAEEPSVVDELLEKRVDRAIRKYVSARYTAVTEAHPDSMRAFFERYYWRIQLRQISARDRATAEDLRQHVLDGEDMDALARENSLDTRAAKGGLHNFKYWADVENRLRDASRGLAVGEVSEVFPYNEAYSFVRVEQLGELDEADYAEYEAKIAGAVREGMNEAAWSAFLDGCVAQVEVDENPVGFAAILADSSRVLSEQFLRDQDEAVITITDGPVVTGTDLRKAVSKQFMKAATTPFQDLFRKARGELIRRAALEHLARTEGFYDLPELEEKFQQDLEQRVIEAYLNEIVVPKIRFNRAEFEEFYQENTDQFRGVEEVRLDFLILHDKAQADEAAARLADGADFDFIRREYAPEQAEGKTESRFAKITMLSRPIREQLETMKTGESSTVLEMPMGWMIFRLDQRREGSVAPMADVEMTIREVMFQKKFNEQLDAHIKLLKERSEIERRTDAIERYFNPEGEG